MFERHSNIKFTFTLGPNIDKAPLKKEKMEVLSLLFRQLWKPGVSHRKLAKPGGRLGGQSTGGEAFFFCDRGLTQASN